MTIDTRNRMTPEATEYGWRMNPSQPRVISVRGGRVHPSGSWLYVWIDINNGEIAYVGGSGFDPTLRTYLHVASDDPGLGRVRATVSRFDERDFDVLAFELADRIDRRLAKGAVIARLAADGKDGGVTQPANEFRVIVDSIVRAVSEYRASLSGAAESPAPGVPRP